MGLFDNVPSDTRLAHVAGAQLWFQQAHVSNKSNAARFSREIRGIFGLASKPFLLKLAQTTPIRTISCPRNGF
jgi:hypothetical protein